MENEKVIEKTYFTPGMLVTLKQDLPNKPIMMVDRKSEITFKNGDTKVLRGIICKWFTTTGELQKEIFSTKDLIKL